jgi:hypothetical protein
MKRPSFNAVALESARRDPETRGIELNLLDAKGHSQNVTLSNTALTDILSAVFQKRMEDPSKDFFLDECIPLAGFGSFKLPSGHVGLRLYLNPREVFDVAFSPEVQPALRDAFRFMADHGVDAPKG